MTASTFKDLILPAVLLTGSLFTALTVPLAIAGQQSGSKPLDIQFQDEQLYRGTVAEAAIPYMGLAATISLAAGGAAFGVGQWRRSLKTSKQASQQVMTLEQQLKQTQLELEEALFSDSQLQTSGLSFFLGDSPLPSAPVQSLGTVTLGLGSLNLTPSAIDQPMVEPMVEPMVQAVGQVTPPIADLQSTPIESESAVPSAQSSVEPLDQPRIHAPGIHAVPAPIAAAEPPAPMLPQPPVSPARIVTPVARNTATPFHSHPAPRRPSSAQMSTLPAAQSYLSFARNPTAMPATDCADNEDLSIVGQVQQIQLQIGQLTAQMESLQTMVHQTIAVSAYQDYVAYSYPQGAQGRYPTSAQGNNVQALRPGQRGQIKSPYIVNRSVDLYGVPQPSPAQVPAQSNAQAGQWAAS